MKPEEEYSIAVQRAFSLPVEVMTLENGLAILYVLQHLEFRMGDFDTRSHPCSGSLDADSEIIASQFPSVSDSKIWWMSQYFSTSFNGLADQRIQAWIDTLRSNVDEVFA